MKILLATDGSEYSKAAIEQIGRVVAQKFGSRKTQRQKIIEGGLKMYNHEKNKTRS